MGAARVEIYSRTNRHNAHPGLKSAVLQAADETTSTTATTAGSRITVEAQAGNNQLYARVQVDEACYVAIGADPTAVAGGTGLVWKLAANVPEEFGVRAGDKFSFKDVA